jgi:hypothetical protein
MKLRLLSIGTNAKTVKSDKTSNFLTAILYLAPADIVAGINVCPMAETAGCKAGCLYSAGRGAFSNVKNARIKKTEFFRDNQLLFIDTLKSDIKKGINKSNKLGKKLAVRLNGTSDIPFENLPGSNGKTILEDFQDIQFYDYTKLPGRKVPANYDLTVSYSAANPAYAAKVLKTDKNIAVVFRDKNLPAEYLGREVINGDITDLRFVDKKGVIVGLYAKGDAKKDNSGFVQENIILRSAA